MLEDFSVYCGVKKEQAKDCFRSLDKLDKIGNREVEKELKEKKINSKILSELSGNLSQVEKKIPSSIGVKEMKELFELVKENKLEKFVEFDLSLSRGLEYYTGNVFEVVSDGPSIGGGGRYDELISDFGGQKTPAVGISFGIERILDLVKDDKENLSGFFVAGVSKEFFSNAVFLAQKMREIGLNVEVDLMERNISKNMDYANFKKIPFVVFMGENEVKAKKFKVKNLKTGKETQISFDRLEELKKLI